MGHGFVQNQTYLPFRDLFDVSIVVQTAALDRTDIGRLRQVVSCVRRLSSKKKCRYGPPGASRRPSLNSGHGPKVVVDNHAASSPGSRGMQRRSVLYSHLHFRAIRDADSMGILGKLSEYASATGMSLNGIIVNVFDRSRCAADRWKTGGEGFSIGSGFPSATRSPKRERICERHTDCLKARGELPGEIGGIYRLRWIRKRQNIGKSRDIVGTGQGSPMAQQVLSSRWA